MAASEPAFDRYRERCRALALQILELGFISQGNVGTRFTHCQNPGCRCHSDPPQPHGPYYQWTCKVGGKTVSRWLNKEQAGLYQEWITNRRRLIAIIAELDELSREAGELLLRSLASAPSTTRQSAEPRGPA
jgi:hypothetical protein